MFTKHLLRTTRFSKHVTGAASSFDLHVKASEADTVFSPLTDGKPEHRGVRAFAGTQS